MAVGETDCKWLGVTEVMRLLKDVNEEEIDLQVVSMMDSSPSMVGRPVASCLPRDTFPWLNVVSPRLLFGRFSSMRVVASSVFAHLSSLPRVPPSAGTCQRPTL